MAPQEPIIPIIFFELLTLKYHEDISNENDDYFMSVFKANAPSEDDDEEDDGLLRMMMTLMMMTTTMMMVVMMMMMTMTTALTMMVF